MEIWVEQEELSEGTGRVGTCQDRNCTGDLDVMVRDFWTVCNSVGKALGHLWVFQQLETTQALTALTLSCVCPSSLPSFTLVSPLSFSKDQIPKKSAFQLPEGGSVVGELLAQCPVLPHRQRKLCAASENDSQSIRIPLPPLLQFHTQNGKK